MTKVGRKLASTETLIVFAIVLCAVSYAAIVILVTIAALASK